MEVSELLKKVRRIEIKSRKLSKNVFAGEYHSAFKGKGMAFAEVREYQYGDDIRNIDWNVTARFNHPFVKVFEEERELTVMLLIDVSGSHAFGTNMQLKKELVAEVAAVLAFSAIQNNDKIGVILFSDSVEKFIVPKKGRSHTLRIIRELLTYEPVHKNTNITVALQYLMNSIKKRCTAFVISDFIDYNSNNELNFIDALKIANRKHDIAALQIADLREIFLPKVGLIKIKDCETGKEIWVDTTDEVFRNEYENWWNKHNENLANTFNKCGVDFNTLYTGQNFVPRLIELFENR